MVSVNSCNFVNEKIASAREAAKRAQVRIQSQSIQTEELVIPASLFLYPVRIPKVITNYFVRLLMQRQAIKQRNSKLQQQLQFLTELEAQSFPIQ